VERDVVLLEGLVLEDPGLFARLVSGFFGLKIPAPPPTSAPTSWPKALKVNSDTPRQIVVEIKAVRSIT